MEKKQESFHVRATESIAKRADEWRSKALGIPGRPEAFRRLVDLGLLFYAFIEGKAVNKSLLEEVRKTLSPGHAEKIRKLFEKK